MNLLERIAPGAPCVRTGHRGARGLAPENTLAAMEAGLAAGADVLEFDVQRTRDGHQVVIHDETVDRTSEGSGAVAELTLAELKALDFGYRFTRDGGQSFPFRGQGVRISTLTELLETFPNTVVTVEIKPSPSREHVPETLKTLQLCAPGRAVVGCFEHSTMKRVRALAPEIPTGASQPEIRNFYLLHKLGLAGLWSSPAKVLQIPRFADHDHDRGLRIATRRFVQAAHRGGRSVQVWTINEPELMHELLDWGVDGITTDRPDVLDEVLAARETAS